jgi:hypothetical protein
MRFWSFESRRKIFHHQEGYSVTRSTLQALELHQTYATRIFERLKNYESIASGLCDPMVAAHRIIMIGIDDAPAHESPRAITNDAPLLSPDYVSMDSPSSPLGALDNGNVAMVEQEIPPEPLSPDYSPSSWRDMETPAYTPPRSPDSPDSPRPRPQSLLVIPEAARRLVTYELDQVFTDIGTKIKALHSAFVMTENNDGGVIELQKHLEEKVLAIQTQIKEYALVEKDIINEKLIDEITKMIPSGICAVSQQLMRDPVMADDGRTYDRRYITTWFAKCLSNEDGNRPRPITSPISRAPMTEKLVPNDPLKNVIIELLKYKNAY